MPDTTHASINTTLATQSLTQLTNDITGISGEHIADYICADTFKWGTNWKGHDDGTEGKWTKGNPSKTKLGKLSKLSKLSKGGSPKAAHVLYKLSDGANGVGIDAVWRATRAKNKKKPYAIVEAKASKNEDAPKFMRKMNNTRKPGIASTLGDNAVTDASELIEPLEGAAGSSPARNRRRGSAQRGAPQNSAGPAAPGKSPPPANRVRKVLVQMSHEWIEANIKKAVEMPIAREITDLGSRVYSRHLFYSPAYHPSGSPKDHMQAKLNNQPPSAHPEHDAFHYDEDDVRKAVNKRKATLRKKHGNLPSLKEEK